MALPEERQPGATPEILSAFCLPSIMLWISRARQRITALTIISPVRKENAMGAARQQVEQGIQLFNSGDLDALTALYAEDAVWVSPPGTFTGRQAIREEHERNRTAFPDRHLQTVRLLEDGDCVALECEVTLTHTGPMALPDGTQLPPSGYHATIRAVTIFEVHDGRTTAHRDYFDQLPAMVAMGAFSPPQ